MSPETFNRFSVSNGRTTELIRRVQRWCKENNVSQTALAKELGVSTSLITEWFKGRRFPVSEEALHLLELLKTKPKGKN